MRITPFPLAALPLTLSALLLTGCLGGGGGGSSSGGDSDDDIAPPEMTREHDERRFVPLDTPVAARPGSSTYVGTYDGIQGEAVYVVEVPDDWDGDGLIMYTHGYRGTGANLPSSVPQDPWRDAVLAAGYAWASSSYSANYYDVRAGIEDTNKLALNFIDYLEADHGVRLLEPNQYLISGESLGGHVAAAAVDRENMERTLSKVPYAGAMPMCQAEQNQFQWLGDYPRVMMELSGHGDADYSDFQALLPQMLGTLFNFNGTSPDWSSPRGVNGQRLVDIARNLTGGDRPIFDEGFTVDLWQGAVLGTGGSEGDIEGILARNGYGNEHQVYRWTSGQEPTADEQAFNDQIARVSADEDANLMREDGVRWIPLVQGDFDVPVLTLHTLGDFYVPFRHQQLYREGAEEHGNEDLLVQRAIRATGHCEFSSQEITRAMNDWLDWVNDGDKPAGDDVLEPAVVADADYGCAFTNPQRPGLPACSAN
ncbi:alpha/beta hydrolase [Halopseudomonas bauzanensis]|uniref:alpha/beta hydrolase n=1 Tax=Halopseudomonas bauzanensis TaxID=653930 RepID=UPI0025574B8C|nr:alpha/beta hydrolase [Halopseudomonas bauzanensis]